MQHSDILKLNQSEIELTGNVDVPIEIEAIGAGHSEINANSSAAIK